MKGLPMGRVTVKALEWEAYGGRWRASSPGITVLKYLVKPDAGSRFYVSVNGQPLTGKYATTDAAKAAAQSHFAAAIFAAIDSPPIKAGEAVPERVTEIIVEPFTDSSLVERLRGIVTCGCDDDVASQVGDEAADRISTLKRELVERLRKGRVRYHTYAGPVYAGPTAIEREAADRISTLERELARMGEALKQARIWHESEDKALSKQPPSHGPNGNQWSRLQHQEQMAEIDAALQSEKDRDGGE